MKVKRIAEVLKADGTSIYETVTSDTVFEGLSRIYLYSASQRAELEERLNYLGLQDLFEELENAEAFIYITTDAAIENLQKEAEEKGSKVVGCIEIFSVPAKDQKLPESAK